MVYVLMFLFVVMTLVQVISHFFEDYSRSHSH